MIEILLVTLILISIFSFFARDLLAGTVALSIFSLISALLFYLLAAPDVAITEAAVGAGISTIILIWAIRETRREDEQ